MGIFERFVGSLARGEADPEIQLTHPATGMSSARDEQIQLLERLLDIRFDEEMRGYDGAAVDRLITSVTAHIPNVQEGLQYFEIHGIFPNSGPFVESCRAFRQLSTARIPVGFRGYSRQQVDRIIQTVNDVPESLGVGKIRH